MASPALNQLRSKALELTESERAELAHDLVASLDGTPDAGAVDEWDAEIVRRLQRVQDGSAQSVDRAELQRRMRHQFAPR
jgi:Putative addiction module component